MGKQPAKWIPPTDDEVIDQKPVMKAWTPPAEDEVVEPLKKKDLTVNETKSSDGTTQAGSVVSQEPGQKVEQPSKKSTESNWFTDLGETLAAPVTALVKSAFSSAGDTLPGMVAAGEAGLVKNNYENVIINNSYPPVSTPQGPVKQNVTDDMKKAAVQNYIKKVGEQQYNVEKDAYELSQLRRRSDLLKYSDEQEKERQETMGGIAQTTGQIKDIKTALEWLGSAGGNALGTAPAALAGPVFPFLMEKGEAYKEGLKKISDQTGLSRDEILALDLDKAARENSDISGSINAGLEMAGNLAVFGRLIPKNIATKFISKALTSKFGAPVVAAMGEGITEGIQAMDTELAAMMATGKYKDVFEAVNAIPPEKWAEIREEAYTGIAGGGGVSTVTGLMQNQQRANKLADIKNERATKAKVIQDAKSVIKSSDDEAGLQEAVKIIESNEGTPTLSAATKPVEPAASQTQQVVTPAVQESPATVGQGETKTAATVLEWKPGDIVKSEGRPDRVIKEVIGKMGDRMTKVIFEDGSMGAIDLKENYNEVEKPQEDSTQISEQQAIDKYDNDEKFNIDDLVDELEYSDNPKIREAVSKYRDDVKEGLEIWGGREDSESRETGFVNDVRKALAPSTSITESKIPEAPVQEVQEGSPDLTHGTNYQKVQNEWQVKQSDGSWAPVISKNPNKSKETQNAELKELKDIQAQLEAQEPQNLKMSNTEKGRIAQLPAHTPHGAARKFFWQGGKALWGSDKKRKGIKEEGGLNEGDKELISQHVSDSGMSIDAIAEKISEENPTFSVDKAKQAVIDILAHSDPKNWYAKQMQTEDPEYLQGAEQRFDEKSRLSQQIAELEAQEAGLQETNKQLYENERRVNRGESQEGNGTPAGRVPGEQRQEGGEFKEASVLIRENGNEGESKQALEDLEKLPQSRIEGLNMVQNQAKGTYVSTAKEGNKYESEGKKAVRVKVKVKNPFVVSNWNIFDQITRAIIKQRFDKDSVDDMSYVELDLLAEMVTEHFANEGYDSIYFAEDEFGPGEGEIVVFDRDNVIFPNPYANAVHVAMQTKLSLDFVPEVQLINSNKAIEDRMKQKEIRKRLSILNELIKCR